MTMMMMAYGVMDKFEQVALRPGSVFWWLMVCFSFFRSGRTAREWLYEVFQRRMAIGPR